MKKDKYRRTKTTVSLLNYHFVFCPRYRRKIFDVPGVEDTFKTLVCNICREHDIEILALECHHDHVHMFVSALPTMSPADIMKIVKGATSHAIRNKFPVFAAMPSLWTRSYFVSTAGNVSSAAIQRYVETQKTRP
jgi:putative transposase